MGELLADRGFDVEIPLDAQATRAGVVAGFRTRLGQAGPDDIALFYFSGHRQQVPDQEGDPDEADGCDEALVPYDNRGKRAGAGHLRDDTLGRLVDELDSNNAVLIVDACHSGTRVRGAVT